MAQRSGNRNTFKFRFLTIYGAATLIGVLLLLFGGGLLNSTNSGYWRFTNIVEPTKYNLQSYSIEINQLVAYQQAYLSSGNSVAQEQVQYLQKKLQERIKNLYGFADSLQDAALQVQIDELALVLAKTTTVTTKMKTASAEELSLIISDELIPALEHSNKLSKSINTHLYKKHQLSFNSAMEWLEQIQLVALFFFMLLMAGFYYIVHITRKFILSQVKKLQDEIGEIAKGNLPEALKDPKNELTPITLSINGLLENLHEVKEFSLHVGRGDFESDITVFDNQGELGNALAGMRQSLKEVSAEDKKRDWVNQGLAKFLGIIRDYSGRTDELTYQVLANLVKYVGANQGGIFVVDDQHGAIQLKLEASFAYNRKKYQTKILQPGQGLVGQAYLERDKIYLKEVPASYVNITSGLGEATPRTLYIQPLMVNDEVMGVLELASFREFEPHVQDFIQKVSESVAAAIGTAQNSLRNQLILEQSQSLAEQLRAQEEELRQNTEELQATQEEMQRRLRELEAENEALKANASV
jgi:hypothetical protein